MNELSIYELAILSEILNVDIRKLEGLTFFSIVNQYKLYKYGNKLHLGNSIYYTVISNNHEITWRKDKKTQEFTTYQIN